MTLSLLPLEKGGGWGRPLRRAIPVPIMRHLRRREAAVADIFVSYTSKDRDWAFWIGQELSRLEHQPRIHEWEIDAGGDVPKWTEDRLQATHRVLCVVLMFAVKDSGRNRATVRRESRRQE
jgi:hypothetical protein